jgi:hypothetical protein
MEKVITQKKEVVFEATQSLQLENSFLVLKSQEDIKLHVTVGINSDTYGWFEFYDKQTAGEEWYAEGGLWFRDNELIDYDGVFSLPNFVLDKLQELGYNVEDMKETLNS